MHEEPFIEDIIEAPPHVISTENIDDWECFHDYFSDDDIPNLPQDETIREAYNETYDEMCIMIKVWKVYCLVTFF